MAIDGMHFFALPECAIKDGKKNAAQYGQRAKTKIEQKAKIHTLHP
jgi:hypothetical protein